MEIGNLIIVIREWLSNNLVGVCTSILATIIITLVKVPYFIIKKGVSQQIGR